MSAHTGTTAQGGPAAGPDVAAAPGGAPAEATSAAASAAGHCATGAAATGHAVLYQIVSHCLGYPDPELLARAPLLRAALDELALARPPAQPGRGWFRRRGGQAGAEAVAAPARDAVVRFVERLERTSLRDLELDYVNTFDLSRKHALYLSYWTDGDTRRRGEVLGRFKRAYRECGLMVTPGGELPDYLPMVLEYAALADPAGGRALLVEFRPSLELLRIALEEAESPYAGLLAAVCSTMPGASPQDRQAVMEMAGVGPPRESVGLEPYDARLLPVRGV